MLSFCRLWKLACLFVVFSEFLYQVMCLLPEATLHLAVAQRGGTADGDVHIEPKLLCVHMPGALHLRLTAQCLSY